MNDVQKVDRLHRSRLLLNLILRVAEFKRGKSELWKGFSVFEGSSRKQTKT